MDSIMKEFEHLVVKLDDIKSATDNFNENKVIGRGGFGKVYQGEVSHFKGRSVVAFKRLDRKFGQGDPEFWKEIMMLSRYTHKNLISLLGFCNEGGEKILMYEHASHGSLDRHLSSTTLTWTRRIKICLDVARGISYLHDDKGTQQRVLHRDIKSSNILLDEKWNAKVSDLGLAKIGPANQQHTALFTTTVGTLGYLDPLYLQIGILTKESDVYSFGVVLFEVLCGRLCFEKKHGGNMVQIWKNRYKQQKLDEIIFQELKHQMDPSALEIFSNIAFQCLKKSRKQRPKMSLVVEILENVLEVQELHDQLKKYEEMVKVAVDPLKYGSLEELKVLFSNGVILSSAGKRRLSINDKGEHIERIYIESCLNPTETKDDSLQHPSDDYVNSRFPGGLCYVYQYKFNARVRAEYLSPEISYTVNLVFRYRWEHNVNSYNPLKYKIDGEDETKVFIIYPTSHMREDGWFVVPLYQFTSQHTTLHLDIMFEECWKMLLLAGIELQPSEEKVEHQVIEEYQDIVKAASQSLVYQSLEELKEILSKGVHLNGYKTWLSLNKNGEQCHMISMAECLISNEDFTSRYESHYKSRFPTGLYRTNNKGFKTHVKTQLLSPLITYTVNLVFKSSSSVTQVYADLKYRLRGETTTSTVYLANRRKDDCLFMAELYQFTSDGSIVDLEISFDDHGNNIEGVEGILFQPLEKVEDIQTISDSGIRRLSSNIEEQTMKKNLYSIIEKWFRFNNQEWSYLDENEKKCLMLSARATCSTMKGHYTWRSLPESRFGEALVITAGDRFGIERKIESKVVSLETTYAVYLVYRLPEDQSTFKAPLEVGYGSFAYLVCPRTPVIGPKLDENTSNTVNRPDKLNIIPQQRSDSWMEVKVYEFQTQTTIETISLGLMVWHPGNKDLRGLMVQGIELRPI